MAVLGTTLPTLADWATVHMADGKLIPRVAESMATTNELIMDMVWQEGNLATGDMIALRTSIPTSTVSKLNTYVATSHSGFSTEINSTAMIENWLGVGARVVEMSSDPMGYLFLQGLGNRQSLTQEASRLLWNGSAGNEVEFKGLYARYKALTDTGNYKVLNAGAGSDTDLTSVWLICHGADTFRGIYPKGTEAGLRVNDWGKVIDVITENGITKNMEMYKQHYMWDCGISVVDPNFVVRGANIDYSELSTASPQDLITLMSNMIESVPSVDTLMQVVNPEAARGPLPRASFYMNRTTRMWLRNQIRNKNNVNLTLETVAGRRVLTFDGIPVRVDAAITNSETLVS